MSRTLGYAAGHLSIGQPHVAVVLCKGVETVGLLPTRQKVRRCVGNINTQQDNYKVTKQTHGGGECGGKS